MGIVLDLSIIALKYVAKGVAHGAGEAAVTILAEHFSNHTEQLNRSLLKANDRAWQTLESALVGPSIFDYLKAADDKSLADQLRIVLDNQLNTIKESKPAFCKKCLSELLAARKEARLSAGQARPDELARQVTKTWAAVTDPQQVLDVEWARVLHIADDLHRSGFKNLAELLKLRPGKGSPIIAGAVRFFFQREVETNDQLFHGLTIAKLDSISDRQQRMFDAMQSLVTEHEGKFASALENTLQRLGVIEEELRLLNSRVVDFERRQVERQTTQDEWQASVTRMLETLQMANREIRPADSFSIRNDGEREIVKKLIEQYRQWPDDQRLAFPTLLANVGQLEVASGDFAAAAHDFSEVATLSDEPKAKAEAHFNAYQTALEQRKWSDALTSLKDAVALDAARFAPFSFKRYEPQRILGAGGFGVAIVCNDRHMKKPRVIKSVRTSDLNRNIDEVFAEARALDSLNHPSIIRIADCDFAEPHTGSRPYLVMDYFAGDNLENFIDTEGLLPPTDMLALAIPIAEALQAAHAAEILHRDVKPANILVRRTAETWTVKLIDFGLAIQPTSFESKISTNGPRAQTMAGKSIAGTMHYAAPEQMGQSNAPVGPYSDVFGFGKTLYFALFSTPAPDELERDSLPADVRKFLGRCTARTPQNRLQNFTEVLACIRDLLAAKEEITIEDYDIDASIADSEDSFSDEISGTNPEPKVDEDFSFFDTEEVSGAKPEPKVHEESSGMTEEEKITTTTSANQIPLIIKSKGISGVGRESSEKFVVLKDSQAVLEAVPSFKGKLLDLRTELIKKGILVLANDRYVMIRDHEFGSASAAASVLLGRNANGRMEWKDADGRTLKSIQNAGKPIEELVRSKLKRIEKSIWKVERFQVLVTFNGKEDTLAGYDYENAANKEITVAQWRVQRFTENFPDCEVRVLLKNGHEAHGMTHLSTVRDSYEN